MNNNVLHINNFEMEDFSTALNSTSINSEDLGMSGKQQFSRLTEKNLFGSGMNVITNRFENLAAKLKGAEQSILKNNKAIFDLEKQLKEEATGIVIPKNFFTNDINISLNAPNVSLSKTDGQSVNMGNITQQATIQNNSNINTINLQNVNNNSISNSNQPLNTTPEISAYSSKFASLKDSLHGGTVTNEPLKFREAININALKERLNEEVSKSQDIEITPNII